MTNHPNRNKGPMFARRHYEAMASMLRRNYPREFSALLWTKIRDDTANLFAEDNDAFDRSRFIAACKPTKVDA